MLPRLVSQPGSPSLLRERACQSLRLRCSHRISAGCQVPEDGGYDWKGNASVQKRSRNRNASQAVGPRMTRCLVLSLLTQRGRLDNVHLILSTSIECSLPGLQVLLVLYDDFAGPQIAKAKISVGDVMRLTQSRASCGPLIHHFVAQANLGFPAIHCDQSDSILRCQ